MVMVSPEMDPTICWMFEAEIVLLFHAKTFHKGFQVTVHIGNVRQTATVEAMYGKVSSATELWLLPCFFPYFLHHGLSPYDMLPYADCSRPFLHLIYCNTGGAEDRGESSGTLQVHQAPRIPEGGSQGAL